MTQELKIGDKVQRKSDGEFVGKLTYIEDGYVETTTPGGAEFSFDALSALTAYVPPPPEPEEDKASGKEYLCRFAFEPAVIKAAKESLDINPVIDDSGQPKPWTAHSDIEKVGLVAILADMDAQELLERLNGNKITMKRLGTVVQIGLGQLRRMAAKVAELNKTEEPPVEVPAVVSA